MPTTHPAHVPTPTNLPSPLAFGEACRRAALEVLNDGPRWDGVDLALWLRGSYARLAVQVTDADEWPATILDRRMLGRMVSVARIETLGALDAAAGVSGIPPWVAACLTSGFVIRTHDEGGRVRFVPSTRPRRLVDCVLSLLAVDYLVRPADYGGLLSCARCARIEIGPHACGAVALRPGGSSLVVPRGRAGQSLRPEGA